MNHVVAVRVVERARNLACDPERLFDRELALAVEPLPQCRALDVGHGVVQEPARLTGLVQRDDVRMAELRPDLDFTQEPLGSYRRGQLR